MPQASDWVKVIVTGGRVVEFAQALVAAATTDELPFVQVTPDRDFTAPARVAAAAVLPT